MTKQGSSSSFSLIATIQAGFEAGVIMGDPEENGIGNGREPKNINGIPSSLRAKLAIIRGIVEFVVVDIISSSDPAIAKLNNSLAGFQYGLINYFIGPDPG